MECWKRLNFRLLAFRSGLYMKYVRLVAESHTSRPISPPHNFTFKYLIPAVTFWMNGEHVELSSHRLHTNKEIPAVPEAMNPICH